MYIFLYILFVLEVGFTELRSLQLWIINQYFILVFDEVLIEVVLQVFKEGFVAAVVVDHERCDTVVFKVENAVSKHI